MRINTPFVSVCMITYNHENYIAQAIESVLLQQVDFQIELVIGEDFSKDNTRKICEEYAQKYPHTIKLLPSEENLGMLPNFVRTLQACRGKYIALCEGDDYWTDPKKIQKQASFLENNPSYAIHYFNANFLQKRQIIKDKHFGENPYTFTLQDSLVKGKRCPTLTMFFRRECLSDLKLDLQAFFSKMLIGDWPLEILCLLSGRGFYSQEVVGVYRVHETGAITSIKKQIINPKLKSRYLVFLNFLKTRKRLPHFLFWKLYAQVCWKLFLKEYNFKYVIDIFTFSFRH